jgi:transposase-like protein
MKYSEGFRASIVRKAQDGSGRSVYQVARETGINATTIKNWITQFKNGTLSMDGCDAVTPSQRNPGEKLALLLENQTIPETAKGEWLRQHGLHSEHLQLWEQELVSIMNDKQFDLKAENTELKKSNKQLQKDIKRQEKALAELAILISLKKKYPTLYGENEGD